MQIKSNLAKLPAEQDTLRRQGCARPSERTPQGQIVREVKTGIERLGEKSNDSQRLDNCKVPLDCRGTKLRPEGCAPNL